MFIGIPLVQRIDVDEKDCSDSWIGIIFSRGVGNVYADSDLLD